MVEQEKNSDKYIYGLLGKNISYSFSKQYFANKFKAENISNAAYINFDIPTINDVRNVFTKRDLVGLNITIPYKEQIIPFLDDLSPSAKEIVAVNTVVFQEGKKIGHNTDVIGFRDSLKPLLKNHHKKALVLGTGGASKAISYALNQLDIDQTIVSRKINDSHISYSQIDEDIISTHTIIINCTPLGTYPEIHQKPIVPYQYITQNHILYDLIYNPKETAFLRLGKEQGATVKNGLEMLEIQAEESWKIWNMR